MSDFFRNMTFPRLVVLFSLVASAVLGYFVWVKGERLEEVQRELARTPELVKEIQELGIELTNYQEVARGEILKGEDLDFETYIRTIAADPRVEIGQLDLSPREQPQAGGIVDRVYTIKPDNPNQRYHRSRIGNFLYKLEAESRRVKVTRLALRPKGRLKPGELGDDLWSFEAEITMRTKEDG